jgi:hypothetical protein
MVPIRAAAAAETTIAGAPVRAARFLCGGCVAVGATTSTPHLPASPTISHHVDQRNHPLRTVRPEPVDVDRQPPIEDT